MDWALTDWVNGHHQFRLKNDMSFMEVTKQANAIKREIF